MKNNKKSKPTGAGIICYFDNRKGEIKEFSSEILFLVLEDFKNKYDLTKGTIDEGEKPFSCALRETYEESNLEIIDFKFIDKTPLKINDKLEMFLGQLKKETVVNRKEIIKLKVNKQINSPEHSKYHFLNYEDAKSKLYKFLIPYLQEAFTIIS